MMKKLVLLTFVLTLMCNMSYASAVDDFYTISTNTTLIDGNPGIKRNDTTNGFPTKVSGPFHGTLQLYEDGGIIYEPDLDFSGTDTFTYRLFNFSGNSNIATVTIKVGDPPIISQNKISDNFEDGVIDSILWSTPHGNVTEANGVLSMQGRNYIVTKDQYDPSPDQPVTIEFDWKIQTYAENRIFLVYTRADGTNTGGFGTARNGIFTSFYVDNSSQTIFSGATVYENGVGRTPESGAYTSTMPNPGGEYAQIRVTDNGYDITLSVNDTELLSFQDSYNPSSNLVQITGGEVGAGVIDNICITQPEFLPDVVVDENADDIVIEVSNLFEDANGDTLTLSASSSNSSLVQTSLPDNQNLTLSFLENQNGNAEITVTASDGTFTVSELFTVTVIPNNPPVAANDSYNISEDTQLTIASLGVLANDTDTESSSLSAVIVDETENGALAFNSDGSFTYIPNANFNGTDSFTYKANDGYLDSEVATVSISIMPVNDIPVSVADFYSTDEDITLLVSAAGILANDTDADDDSLTAVLVDNVDNGTLTLNSNGSFEYIPNPGFSGEDSFTYTAYDGTENSTQVTVTITIKDIITINNIGEHITQTRDDILTELGSTQGMLSNDILSLSSAFNHQIESATEIILEASNSISAQIGMVKTELQTSTDSLTNSIENAKDEIINENSDAIIDAKTTIINNIDSLDHILSDLILGASQSILDANNFLANKIDQIECPEISFDEVILEINANEDLIHGIVIPDNANLIQDASLSLSQQISSIEFPETDLSGVFSGIENNAALIQGIEIPDNANLIQDASVFLSQQISSIEFPETDLSGVFSGIENNAALIQGIEIPDNANLIQDASLSLSQQISSIEFPETDLSGVITEIEENEDLIIGVDLTANQILDHVSSIEGTIVNNSNINTVMILRMIEENQIETHLTNKSKTALLVLPESVGGKLDMVHDLVEKRISQFADLGFNVNKAQSDFDNAVNEMNDNDYSKAYDLYEAAYKELLKIKL